MMSNINNVARNANLGQGGGWVSKWLRATISHFQSEGAFASERQKLTRRTARIDFSCGWFMNASRAYAGLQHFFLTIAIKVVEA